MAENSREVPLTVRQDDSKFPPELLDELIDQLDETSTLLSCGLVSKRALVRTRHRLISTLEFRSDKDFEQFLNLAGAPWTSFTSAVEEIHLQDLFCRNYDYGNERDPKTIASNLCNVKTLSIFIHSLWKYGWKQVPRFVLDVIFELKIHDLQLDGVGMTKAEDVVALFRRLSPTLKTLAFRRLRFKEIEHSGFSRHLSIFRRPLHFRILDNISLAFFKHVLDPLVNPGLDVTIHTFHIRDPVARAADPLTWRFLQHIGHSVEQLLITFIKPYTFATFNESIKYLEPTQVLQCINLRTLFIGFPNFAYASLVSAMWKMLSALPSPNLLEELQFKFILYDSSVHEYLSKLGFFESPNCLDKFRSLFPNLKLIKIILGIYNPENTDMFFEAVRRVKGLKELEEIGILKLVTFHLKNHVACHSVLETCR
ncbi:hypothetical protein F5887DRAFT_1218229 [Amanita rubescens]|nr:hypothetical protein F5887DRAFT_1218229 [Amanita rubescens]